MPQGIRQKCRLLLEGREVPFVSATLICNVGEPITAIIELVPLQVIKFIKPKTQIQIFVQDTFNFGDDDFYIAFEGEATGRAMRKTDGSRAFQITAVDYSGYWDEAKGYYYNHNFVAGKLDEIAEGGQSPEAETKEAGATRLTTASTINSIMISIITKAMKGSKTDIIDGIVDVVSALKNINLFYSAAFNRLRITDRVQVFSSGRIKTFLQDLNMDEFLLGFTGRQGGLVSLREMLLNVMALIFHDFVSVPFPSLVAGKAGQTISNFLFIPDGYALPPPACNVIFPNYVQSFEFRDDFRSMLTRFAFRPSFPQYASDAVKVYPMQYYPDSFKDFMYGTATETNAEYYGLLGTSTILKDPKTGRSYGGLSEEGFKYGSSAKGAVGAVSASPVLREADFLTNEESIKGIILDTETFMPGMTTLTSHNSAGTMRGFTQAIGTYLFYKKRFSSRNATAQLMFHPFLVPGFSCLVVDDSDAGQSFVAKLQSVTHNLSQNGCSTTAQMGYARDFDEIDSLTGGSAEPPLPPWFDPKKFGSVDENGALFKQETQYLLDQGFLGQQAADPSTGIPELAARKKIATQPVTIFNFLSSFYQQLVGTDSVTTIDSKTDKSSLVTLRGAAYWLTETYKQFRNDPEARDSFVVNYIQRPVPNMFTTMFFLGAVPLGDSGLIPEEFAEFVSVKTGSFANRFDGKGFADEKILQIRREVINAYVELLKTQRGFNG